MVNRKEPIVKNEKPIIASHLAPIRSKIRPVIGDRKPVIKAPGRITNPDSAAVKFLPSCIYKGTSVSTAINPIKPIIPSETVTGKMEYVKTRNSSMGYVSFNCLKINHVNDIAPIMSGDMVNNESQPLLPALVKPYNNPPKPNEDNI